MLHLYFDQAMTNMVSENAQTVLTSDTTTGTTNLAVESSVGFTPGDTVRLGEIQRTIQSVPDGTHITLSTSIGTVFSSGTLVTKSNMVNPDTTTGSGTDGYTDEKALYLGNDASNKRYESVQLTAINDDSGIDIKYAPDSSGSSGTYVDTLNVGSISENGGASDVIKIWRKVIVAGGQESQERVDIKHKIQGVEYHVY